MAKKWAELASKLPSAKSGEPKCPLCAGKVVYQGFTALECGTFGCDNGPATDPLAEIKEQLAKEWGGVPYAWFPISWPP